MWLWETTQPLESVQIKAPKSIKAPIPQDSTNGPFPTYGPTGNTLTAVALTPSLCPIPLTPSFLAQENLRNHYRDDAHPLRSIRKAAPPRLTGPLALQVFI